MRDLRLSVGAIQCLVPELLGSCISDSNNISIKGASLPLFLFIVKHYLRLSFQVTQSGS